jgi:hypothetical protein
MDEGLLPLVHKLWQPLTKRFSDSDKVVVMKTLETVAVMAEVSKEFLTGKFATDVSCSYMTLFANFTDVAILKVRTSC